MVKLYTIKLMDFFKNNKKIIIPIAILILLPILVAFIYTIKKPFFQKLIKTPAVIQIPPYQAKPASLQIGPFNCPSVTNFCKKGKDVMQANKYLGLGATVATSSAVFAAFDGEITSSISSPKSDVDKIVVVYLDNKDRGLRGLYYYQGTKALEARTVKKGEKIDTLGTVMPFYNLSLVFSIIKNDPLKEDRIHLQPSDFAAK